MSEAVPKEILSELGILAHGEPIGLVVRDPENGRHYIRPITLSQAPEREAARLYLEWITAGGKVRTLRVD